MNTINQVKPNRIFWDHDQFKAAREELGLSLTELAVMLDTDPRSLRAIESDPSQSTHRAPAPRMVRLMEAYLAGYRPIDWPKD